MRGKASSVFILRRVHTLQINHPSNQLAFLRVRQIVGDSQSDPPVPPMIPIGRSTWWQWVRDGKAPAPVKLGPRTTAWKSSDISALIESLNATKTGGQ